MTLRQMARLFLPPILVQLLQRIRARTYRPFMETVSSIQKPEWEYVPEGWEAQLADSAIKGWNDASILESYLSRWQPFLKSLEGTLPLGISPEANNTSRTNLTFHNLIMSYGFALAVAAREKGKVSVLDWGGNIGHYYLISKALLPDLELDYHCFDLPTFVEFGRRHLREVHFHSSEDCLTKEYDFVLASGALHYKENWREAFSQLASATGGYLFTTRVPTIHRKPSYVMIQRPYAYGYNTEYLGWCLNREEVLTHASGLGLELLREFVVEAAPYIEGAPEQCDYWGYLFRPS